MNNNVKTSKTRDPYWQYVRGMCIICVILIHCKNGIEYRGSDIGAWNFDYWLILRQLINFPVAIFIFLSGYVTNIERSRKFNMSYISNRGERLLVPFLVWSTFYTIFNIIRSDEPINVIKIIAKLLLGLSSGQLYFILVLLQLTVLTPFLIKVIENSNKSKHLFWVTPIYLLVLYIYSFINKSQLPFYSTPFLAWFNFYYLGLWIKIKGYIPIFKRHQVRNSILLCIVGLVLSIFEGYLLLYFNMTEGFASSQIKISSFMYTFAIINLIFVVKPYIKNTNITWLKNIGDISYGIYYVHMFWISVTYKLLSYLTISNNFLPLFQLIQLVSTIILSYLNILVTRKIIGEKRSRKYLGF